MKIGYVLGDSLWH